MITMFPWRHIRLRALLKLQRFSHTTLAQESLQAQIYTELGSNPMVAAGKIDISRWKKMDSRKFGITQSMIPVSSWVVLKLLRSEGFEAYLVGGCVRDLLLTKIPKDFDVITTANLQQIKKKFHRAQIVGRRFPICRVHVKGSVIEVSSFETMARHDEEREYSFPKMPGGCAKMDFIRWRNSVHRDFTVNSLFYDPFANKIYDYADGMTDLASLKLRTLIPANLSFKEDCARILRGLRIAARLGLSFSKDTEFAMRNLSALIKNLDKSRLMMELNYMLSYGAAEPSFLLLRRFKLLEVLLPFHAAYLTQQSSGQATQNSIMLLKLFFNLDKLISCDQPCDSCLWICLLAFHIALVTYPQEALVVWTFSSVLYHGKWTEGVKVARKHAGEHVNFVPEISNACNCLSDEELTQRVSEFASIVQDSVDALTDSDCLLEAMAKYPSCPCSGLVLVSQKAGSYAAQIFDRLAANDLEERKRERKSYEINYNLLGKGDMHETRFVLGKIIIDTLSSGINRGGPEVAEEDIVCTSEKKVHPIEVDEKPKSVPPPPPPETPLDAEKPEESTKMAKQVKKSQNIAEKKQKVEEIISHGDDEEPKKAAQEVKLNRKRKSVEKLLLSQHQMGRKCTVVKKNARIKKQKKKEIVREMDSKPPLSSLFK
ncbi:hypothetical protein Nepgr_026380 [Nepenthes gracilis]|uniref:Uncharacterized protein n=1 Tax=Nepenthes gracilis TaxID=150966 RepID=A0AAD3Y0C4_NEPGR|nr:hypothetical protein Nepgr_026380 [Nepenthes gracilis]